MKKTNLVPFAAAVILILIFLSFLHLVTASAEDQVIADPTPVETVFYLDDIDGYATPQDSKAVRELQKLLNGNLDFINSNLPRNVTKSQKKLVVDGDFGQNTSVLLKLYQYAAGLTVDGICGQKTWEALGSTRTDVLTYSPDLYREFNKGNSDYACLLAQDTHLYRIFEIQEDGWRLIYSWPAATGDSSAGKITPSGSFLLTDNDDLNHKYLKGTNSRGLEYRAYGATYVAHIRGLGYFYVHEILRFHKKVDGKLQWVLDSTDVLGKSATAGCVRLAPENNDWIIENLRCDTPLVIVDRDPLKDIAPLN